MLNNKDSFVLEYIRNTKKNIDKIKIDWSQSKVIFIANSFTSYQQNARILEKIRTHFDNC